MGRSMATRAWILLEAFLVTVVLTSCGTVGGGDSDSAAVSQEAGDQRAANEAVPVAATSEGEASSSTSVDPTADPVPAADAGEGQTTAAVRSGEAVRVSTLDASTRRSLGGLPPEVRGYVAWFQLPAPKSVDGSTKADADTHPEDARVYIRLSQIDTEATGVELTPPLSDGTRLVRESKRPADDFVRRIDVMVRRNGAWEFASFGRDRPAVSFQQRGASASCAGCHTRAVTSEGATSYGVYSGLTLEDF